MKIALSGRMGNDLPWEREGLTWGRNIYRLTIKWTSSKTALGVTSTDSFKCTASQKMHISEYVYKTFLEELTFLCREIIAACDISKTVTLPQVFFFHFFEKNSKWISMLFKDTFFPSISTSQFVPFKVMHVFIH